MRRTGPLEDLMLGEMGRIVCHRDERRVIGRDTLPCYGPWEPTKVVSYTKPRPALLRGAVWFSALCACEAADDRGPAVKGLSLLEGPASESAVRRPHRPKPVSRGPSPKRVRPARRNRLPPGRLGGQRAGRSQWI